MKQTRIVSSRDLWLQLYASWNVEVKRVVKYHTKAALNRAIKQFWDHTHPLYRCPRDAADGFTIILPKLAIQFIDKKDVHSVTTVSDDGR